MGKSSPRSMSGGNQGGNQEGEQGASTSPTVGAPNPNGPTNPGVQVRNPNWQPRFNLMQKISPQGFGGTGAMGGNGDPRMALINSIINRGTSGSTPTS